MRIIAGKLKGRTFFNKSDATHPMSEKMRGSIFNTLGDIEGLTFLDCYSGTGAIAFEAASRGAKRVIAIESNKKSQENIDNNIRMLGIDKLIELKRSTINGFIEKNLNLKFNIVVCDPPYNNYPEDIVEKASKLLDSKGVLVISCPSNMNFKLNNPGLTLIKDKSFADGRLVFFKQNI
jgi:16S rRNA (guanine966-N2)-methyltransferase